MWRSQAEAEPLTLLEADNQTGYFCVYHQHGKCKPYKAEVLRRGKLMYLGNFVTAEEAALCVARTPEGRKAAKRPAAAPPLTSEETRQQAEAEGLTLLAADNKTGYLGVKLDKRGKPKPYRREAGARLAVQLTRRLNRYEYGSVEILATKIILYKTKG